MFLPSETNPFFSIKFKHPDKEIANTPIERSRLELIVCRSIILDLTEEIRELKEHPLYQTDEKYIFNIEQADRFLFQVKSLAGIEFRTETGASPLFQLHPAEITIYNANCLLSNVDGHIWEARNILNQHDKKTKVLLLEIVNKIISNKS